MNFKRTRKTVLFTTIVFMLGASVAFAHGGWGGYGGGRGPMMNYQGGPMMGPGNYGPPMRGYRGGPNQLTEEEIAKVAPLREKFFQDTEELRLKFNEKQFALRQEMTKKSPDQKKAVQLQNELSDLRSQLDQKALEHRLEVRKLLPEKTFGPGMGRGYGRGRGSQGGWGGFCR